MSLPAVDLGIMAEHLSTHKGVIHKLKMYYSTVQNPDLSKLLKLHIKVLRNHVNTMLALINPDRNGEVHLPSMEIVHLSMGSALSEMEKDIVLEARATAKLMGSDNFNSALMMKDTNVKNVHLQMSYQDVTMQMLYGNLLKAMNGEFVPKVSKEMQRLTFEKYQHVQNE
ncbi:hypothetical protein J7E71_23270 [Mesobacillus foraminis]|uniref:hypothetical protein n=1 Tax=Mesobacillus foraminis TaxID=279826 RepID=UPI001BE5BAE0|nr:hypothetical protein [Mesobacillus foraminis]MBT2758796.1 hypothetical protein [Mesobacillus foraminis]